MGYSVLFAAEGLGAWRGSAGPPASGIGTEATDGGNGEGSLYVYVVM